uniref:Uncharacterized protein n=1 Tax=Rhizophora mucronata TaxID=61149 RepID=A0A2P2NG13_RHIMU
MGPVANFLHSAMVTSNELDKSAFKDKPEAPSRKQEKIDEFKHSTNQANLPIQKSPMEENTIGRRRLT